mgnify:CR=1 FL=1
MDKLKNAATGGYLVVGEFSKAPVPHYIWGAHVRLVFDTLSVGYSLATALHASGLEETFDVINTPLRIFRKRQLLHHA